MRITGEMGNLAAWEKRLFYMCSARPTLHPRALFSDVTSDYRNPAEPEPGDEVTIRLRTGRYNVDKAYSQGRALPLILLIKLPSR